MPLLYNSRHVYAYTRKGVIAYIYVWATDIKSIIVGGSLCRCIQEIETSTYVPNCIVCLSVFVIVDVYRISYKCSQKTKLYKMGSYYGVRKAKRKKVGSLRKLN
jgi:hypothetical protein